MLARGFISPRFVLPTLLGALVLGHAATAEAQALRFSRTATGGVVATGNTLGLSKQVNANGPGTADSIGTFLSLDGASVDDMPANPGNSWPLGTTNDWMANGSTAVLSLPAEAEVVYAELVWAGSYQYQENVAAFRDSAVTLAMGGASISVTPDPNTVLNIAETSFTGFAANYYMRSANVTNFVETNGEGTYSVSGVPATQGESINSLNAAGWTLLVAYLDEGSPARNLTIFVGGSFVDEDAQQDYSVAGFCTPPAGPVEGNAVVSALEGDADLGGDTLRIGQTTASFSPPLSGPNNPAANFFASQINDSNGQLDTRGSFGTANQNAAGQSNVVGGRQGWDITTVALSKTGNQLANAQTSAVLRTTTTGDSFVPVALAFEIDVNAPDFSTSPPATASATIVRNGDQFIITATLRNSGDVPADLSFRVPLDPNLTLISYTTDGNPGDISGAAVTTADLTPGVPAGTLAPGAQRQIVVTVEVLGPPVGGAQFGLLPVFDYSYVSCIGEAPIEDLWAPTFLAVQYDGPTGAGGMGGGAGASAGGSAGASAGGAGGGAQGGAAQGGANQGGAAGTTTGVAGTGAAPQGGATGMGAGGQAGAGATGGFNFSGPRSGDDGGCACSTPGRSDVPSWPALALTALGALVLGRRRRR